MEGLFTPWCAWHAWSGVASEVSGDWAQLFQTGPHEGSVSLARKECGGLEWSSEQFGGFTSSRLRIETSVPGMDNLVGKPVLHRM